MKDLYLKTHETVKEETNTTGETTHFIKGEMSLDGEKWEDCTVIWSED